MYRFTLGTTEKILKKGMATLHADEEAFSGALYLTNERLVFVGYLIGIKHAKEKAVSLKHIREIKAGKTWFIIPNLLDVTVDDNEQFTLIVQGRDEWLEAIRERMAATGHEQTLQGAG